MVKRDPDYSPNTDMDITTGRSQSQIIDDVNTSASLSLSVKKPCKTRKYKNRARKRKPPQKRFRIPPVPKIIHQSPSNEESQESFLDSPATSSHIIPSKPDTSASMKLGKDFIMSAKEPATQMVVRDTDLHEKVVSVTKVTSNIVFHSTIFQSLLDFCAICKICRKGSLILWDKSARSCIGRYLTLRCNYCGSGKDFWSISGRFGTKIKVGDFQISKRNDSIYQSVLGGRLIGVGTSGLNIYHSLLGLGLAPFLHDKAHKDLLLVAEYIAKNSMDRAAIELEELNARDENKLIHDIASFDGAYQKRSTKWGGGFSRYCFASAISMTTGKVLAYEVACNSCGKCTQIDGLLDKKTIDLNKHSKMMEEHMTSCPAKFKEFASVSLESQLAPVVLRHALKRGIIFDSLVCDGDNKTFAKLEEDNPYRDKAPKHRILKSECLAHVGKRMKTHLIEHQREQIKKANTRNKLKRDIQDSLDVEISETSASCSKGNAKRGNKKSSNSNVVTYLNNQMCSRISAFYQLAIKRNKGNIDAIMDAISAIPMHLGANEANAHVNHQLCPKGSSSWCQYYRTLTGGNESHMHTSYLSEEAASLVNNVFTKYNYNKEYFVKQISDGLTSNHNEALHNILFCMVRKTDSIGMDSMKLGSALAVIRYNEGYRGILKILESLQVEIHSNLIDYFAQLDKKRVERSYKYPEIIRKRFISRIKRQRKNTTSIRKFGKSYDSGKYCTSNLSFTNDDVDLPSCSDSILDVSSSDVSEEKCGICARGENEEIEDVNILVDNESINWILCESCNSWFHFACIGLGECEDFEEETWRCPACFT